MKNSNKKKVTRSSGKVFIVMAMAVIFMIGTLVIGITKMAEKENVEKIMLAEKITYSIGDEGIKLYADGERVNLPKTFKTSDSLDYFKFCNGTYFCLSVEKNCCYYIGKEFITIYELKKTDRQENGCEWEVTMEYEIKGRYHTYELCEFILTVSYLKGHLTKMPFFLCADRFRPQCHLLAHHHYIRKNSDQHRKSNNSNST